MADKKLSTVSDAPVDLEKGTASAAIKEREVEDKEQEQEVAKWVNGFMDALLVFNVVYYSGLVVWAALETEGFLHTGLSFLMGSLYVIFCILVFPTMKKIAVNSWATTKKRWSAGSDPSDDSDLRAKLLASSASEK